jgi:hypothetical protein
VKVATRMRLGLREREPRQGQFAYAGDHAGRAMPGRVSEHRLGEHLRTPPLEWRGVCYNQGRKRYTMERAHGCVFLRRG